MDTGLAVRFGVGLGAAVFVWQVVSAALGASDWFVPVAIGIQCGVLIALFARPGPGQPMGGRIATGAAASALGAVMVFCGSLVVSQVLFPDLLASLPDQPSAVSAAAGGLMGTLVTGVVLSGLLGFLQRNREG